MVLLGTPNAESSRLYAMTVSEGDPSWAGALAGVALGLPVYHVMEEAVKTQVAPEVYEEQVALMEMVLEAAEIAHAVQDVRASTGPRFRWPSFSTTSGGARTDFISSSARRYLCLPLVLPSSTTR